MHNIESSYEAALHRIGKVITLLKKITYAYDNMCLFVHNFKVEIVGLFLRTWYGNSITGIRVVYFYTFNNKS